MVVLLGGIAAFVLGLIGLIAWWQAFFTILKGGIPVALLIGGVLAVFVGLDEFKKKFREEQQQDKDELLQAREELERTRAEADKYREELERDESRRAGGERVGFEGPRVQGKGFSKSILITPLCDCINCRAGFQRFTPFPSTYPIASLFCS